MIAEGSRQVRMREGARRRWLALGAGLALGTTAVAATVAAGAPAALAASGSTHVSGVVRPPAMAGPAVSGSVVSGSVVSGSASGLPLSGNPAAAPVTLARLSRAATAPAIAPLRGLLQADLLVVAPATLPASIAAAVRRMAGVAGAQQVDAARIGVNGKLTAMLGVDPSAFRAFAARPTARSLRLWQNVAAGGVAVSYTMGKLDRLPADGSVRVDGRAVEDLPVAGFGTVGIAGVDAVVSDATARSLGIPAGNAIVISAPHAELNPLMTQIRKLLPRRAAIAPLVAQTTSSATGTAGVTGTGVAGTGVAGTGAADGSGLSRDQLIAFLRAAESRLGLPYVWGGDGPGVFDCSGLVQWSLARAGVVMPRVAADQARTGPPVPLGRLQPGDLLFYHTDPTAPGYISHVAIYLGDGMMLQAPQPGQDVEVVPASFGSEFAGAVRVYPRIAAAVAGNPAG